LHFCILYSIVKNMKYKQKDYLTPTQKNRISVEQERARVGEKILATIRLQNILEPIQIQCTILDYKYSFGHHRYLVSPIDGIGKFWTQSVQQLPVPEYIESEYTLEV